jgi:N-carbamoylputrescine amidase
MPGDRRLTVGVAQVRTVLGDIQANLAKHVALIDAAHRQSVDVLLFPELSLTGYSVGAEASSLGMTEADPRLRELAALSGPMLVVVGAIERMAVGRPTNTALGLCHGEIAFRHRKLNLPGYGRLTEASHFAAGDSLDTYQHVRAGRVGTLICADLWNPALVHLSALQAIDLLLAPISSALEAVGDGFDNPAGWETVLAFYSLLYGLPVAMANRVGTEADLTFWGGSRILDPFGRVLTQANTEEETLLVASIDLDDVPRARLRLPTIRDSNPALIGRELARIQRAMVRAESAPTVRP